MNETQSLAFKVTAIMLSIIIGGILTGVGYPIGVLFTIAGIAGSFFAFPKVQLTRPPWVPNFETKEFHEHNHVHNHNYGHLTEGLEVTEERLDGTAVITRQIRKWQ